MNLAAKNTFPNLGADTCATVVALLRYRALQQPNNLAYTFLPDRVTEAPIQISYSELDRRACTIAARLQRLGLAGEHALLLYPSGLDYIAAFLGCLYAGVVAVPAYPPRPNRSQIRLQTMAADARPAIALTCTASLALMHRQFGGTPALAVSNWLCTDEDEDWSDRWHPPDIDGQTLAFLQYTSGSTSTPKGVMVSHSNLLYNERMIKQGFGLTDQSVIVGWLPFYHDMGLIGNVLQPLYLGAHCVLMSPSAFLQRPVRWLQAITEYRGTTSGGPNFAYELCLSRVSPEQYPELDLSSWSVAFLGAEPIRAETLDLFANTFAAKGFQRKAFYPCYGMAETTLIVSGSAPDALPILKSMCTAALEQNRVVADGGEAAKVLVGCGRSLLNQQVVIVHPETLLPCTPDEIGEIWVSGPHVARGYWDNPEATERTFGARLAGTGEGPFLRTGDLGFLEAGELFITGRLKDLIIIRGRNHYPQDIEWTVGRSHPSLRPDCTAAFSIEQGGTEQLVIVQEVDRHCRNLSADEVTACIRQAVAECHELQVHRVIFLKTESLPKTSSGKIQRQACRAAYLNNTLALWQDRRSAAVVEPTRCATSCEIGG